MNSNNMKRILPIGLVLTLALALISCAAATPTAQATSPATTTAVAAATSTATTQATGTDSPAATATATATATTAAEKTFTKAELAKYDGQNGNPAYIAVNGTVYDVSNVPQWRSGSHQGYNAGTDLTKAIMNAPHGDSVLNNLPVVGKYVG